MRQRNEDDVSEIGKAHLEALLVEHYRVQGYRPERIGSGPALPHLGDDIGLRLYGSADYLIVLCKHGSASPVLYSDVQRLLDIMVAENASGAILATTGAVVPAAAEAAADLDYMLLIDGEALRGMIGPILARQRAQVEAEAQARAQALARDAEAASAAQAPAEQVGGAGAQSGDVAFVPGAIPKVPTRRGRPTIPLPKAIEQSGIGQVLTREITFDSYAWRVLAVVAGIGGLIFAIFLARELFAPPKPVVAAVSPSAAQQQSLRVEAEPPVPVPAIKQTPQADAGGDKPRPVSAAGASGTVADRPPPNPDEAIRVIQSSTPEMWSDKRGERREQEKRDP